MGKKIIVIGGYGHVGGGICRRLGELYSGNVCAAGRSLEKAERFAASTGGKVKAMQWDAGAELEDGQLANVELVIMCLDQSDTRLAEACLRQGVHYIDVSANGPYLLQVEKLHGVAKEAGATALLSLGLAPGLTNMLSRQALTELDEVDEIAIHIMLGLGDSHGKAAIQWMVDQLGAAFEVLEQGKLVARNSFADGRDTDFGGRLGYRKTYRFPFSDQATLPRTLGVETVSTRLCFDSRTMTALMAGMKSMGLTGLLSREGVRRSAVDLFGKLRMGSDRYALKIDAYGRRRGEAAAFQAFLQGNGESEITAAVAAAAADLLYCDRNAPGGVYHSEQLLAVRPDKGKLTLAPDSAVWRGKPSRIWAEGVDCRWLIGDML
ncbi:saccharopine dehydrogenase NADP-binding domain-containing protein [Paenibacillus sp. J5C_2022]|uniref:saccharopine dehydrogenase family protein n=1 Tax=Paenibacillus sp. J5C2022 TaxID=2977129 RepID=UPI0021CFCCE2|nr:saccharopine dehydrogenase NADP-binding domain-containing protein [Paenibacillus sp. J5C2022]MCU6707738.1 saccharopine dehydrogenase NADP-binding domain-containing protein [Paenibacillus sp. J5C2022]